MSGNKSKEERIEDFVNAMEPGHEFKSMTVAKKFNLMSNAAAGILYHVENARYDKKKKRWVRI